MRLPVQITRIGKDPLEHSGQTCDISSSGVRFESTIEVEPGTRIEFMITLSSKIPRVSIRCLGKVLRSQASGGAGNTFELTCSIDRYQFVRTGEPESGTAAA